MIVGVTAGTFIDTKLGEDLLKKFGFESISYPVSKNPKEQDRLQFLDKKTLQKKIEIIARDSKLKKAKALLIYCNSLSSAIDYKKIEKDVNIKIITPMEEYKTYANLYKNLIIIGANSQSMYGIEKILKQENENLNLITLGALPIVMEIELQKNPEEIINKLALSNLMNFFEKIQFQNGFADKIILGCTHFPYIKRELQKFTDIEILDPADGMIKKLKEL
ncbi:MAG: aspartate/glutamate racemase family protein [Peptoniphilaceae bacterium]|nr:aspartate/glutamate racemase family protein [Peptoniphilaceae bacterium]MDY3738622.1 aspartate/glutamate racemase family protein [Peptoniphilaceae bacterium]